MGFNNIEKKNRFYNFLHRVVIFAHNKLFYKNVFVLNAGKIPEDAHLIFTPNHQNALMDALAPLCNINRQLVFLARSDIFNKKLVASILFFLKILPIYRIRDGYGAVKNNANTFQKTIDVINAGNGLVILPEGNHEGVHRLRPLKKGFARIAFQTEASSDYSLNIKIIPFGLHYSDYVKQGSDLYINFGDPVPVSDYYALHKESPPKAVNKLTHDLAEKIKPLMVHIESTENYTFYDHFRVFYWEKEYAQHAAEKAARINVEQEAIALLSKLEKNKPAAFHQLQQLDNSYHTMLDKYGLDYQLMNKPGNSLSLLLQAFGLLAGLPALLYGIFCNLFPLAIVKYAEHSVKDLQFKSSFKFVLSLVLFPLSYLLQFIIIAGIWGLLPAGFLFFVSMPLSLIFTLRYMKVFTHFKTKIRYWVFRYREEPVWKQIQDTKLGMEQLIDEAKTQGISSR